MQPKHIVIMPVCYNTGLAVLTTWHHPLLQQERLNFVIMPVCYNTGLAVLTTWHHPLLQQERLNWPPLAMGLGWKVCQGERMTIVSFAYMMSFKNSRKVGEAVAVEL